MPITRRQLLAAAGLSLSATGIACSRAAIESRSQPPTGGLSDWLSVRDQFNISRDYTDLCAAFFIASHPQLVRDAIEKYRRAIGKNPYLVVARGMLGAKDENLPLKVKRAAASYIGGSPDEIALTGSTTMGLALVYNGLALTAGQEILTTTHDFYAHHESIRLAAERTGVSVRKIALFDKFEQISEEFIVERIRRALRPNTRVVGITWVHSASGVKIPVRAIADAIRHANLNRGRSDRILLVVDGVHGFGVEDDDLPLLGCDFFVSGTHKWIFAPRGTGIIWAPQSNWALLRPTIPSFTAEEVFNAWIEDRVPRGPPQASWVSFGGFHAFEHQWAMAEAFHFHQQIGKTRIAHRIHELNEQCKEGLSKMKHVKLYTSRGSRLSSGIICFDVDGMRQKEVVKRLLAKKIIASTTPYAASYVRVAPSIVNTPDDIEAGLREIRALGKA